MRTHWIEINYWVKIQKGPYRHFGSSGTTGLIRKAGQSHWKLHETMQFRTRTSYAIKARCNCAITKLFKIEDIA